MTLRSTRWLASMMLMLGTSALAAITVIDDAGRTVTLERPARRVLALAPHLTEDLFAIGAGSTLVGVSQYSDYPEAARHIATVGGYGGFDLERIQALHPDLVLAWASGNPPRQIEQIAALGIPVYFENASTLAQIPTEWLRMGVLTGKAEQAAELATHWRQRLAALRQRYAQRALVRVFVEVWEQPLMTVNGNQIISDSLRICGARNVFANLPALVPTVDTEAVLAANPKLIIGSGKADQQATWRTRWQRWPQLAAVSKKHLVLLPADLLSRMGPRILDGTEQLCQAVDSAR